MNKVFRKNLFEVDNARNLNKKELVDTFVPTESFRRLLSAKNHIILGSRGSGKTALVKMISHDHLALMDDVSAKEIIEKQSFIGVYVPTRLEWVGGLRNKPWQDETQKEEYFLWRINLSSCLALIVTLQSCVSTYAGNTAKQAIAEAGISKILGKDWLDDDNISDFDQLRHKLEDVEYAKNLLLSRARASGDKSPSANGPGLAFNTEAFAPLKRGIHLASRILNIKADAVWIICIDEAEFLEPSHHRVINSFMRAYPDNVFIKMTTMPYCHYTLDTNTGASLDVGHDFEYVYIDSDPVLGGRSDDESSTIGTGFANDLFNRRLAASGMGERENINLKNLLGDSRLLDNKQIEWNRDSEEFKLLIKYCSSETIARAERLFGTTQFQSQIARKIHGALLLRDAYDKKVGNSHPEIYSGARLVIRCGDSNPRRLVRIFNALVLKVCDKFGNNDSIVFIEAKEQNRILNRISTSSLSRVQSEPRCGKELFDFLTKIGSYMKQSFHGKKLGTDHVSSIEIDENVSELEWSYVRRAVELGLLYPNVGSNQADEMPNKCGKFHLAFVLSPYFFTMPRKGHSKQLSRILKNEQDLPETQQINLPL